MRNLIRCLVLLLLIGALSACDIFVRSKPGTVVIEDQRSDVVVVEDNQPDVVIVEDRQPDVVVIQESTPDNPPPATDD